VTRREVLVFVRRGAEVLVLLRSPEGGGYWHSVAGGVEPGESDREAAGRELREETGFDTALLEPVGDYVYEPYDVACSCFVVDVPEAWEPVLDHEHVEYRWCSRAEATRLLHWPEPRALLETVCAS
jgi:dATP pyrophosphohydrolase